jgi:hypothetical protein
MQAPAIGNEERIPATPHHLDESQRRRRRFRPRVDEMGHPIDVPRLNLVQGYLKTIGRPQG